MYLIEVFGGIKDVTDMKVSFWQYAIRMPCNSLLKLNNGALVKVYVRVLFIKFFSSSHLLDNFDTWHWGEFRPIFSDVCADKILVAFAYNYGVQPELWVVCWTAVSTDPNGWKYLGKTRKERLYPSWRVVAQSPDLEYLIPWRTPKYELGWFAYGQNPQ